MKKCTLPVKVPMDVPVVKIVSGEVSSCFYKLNVTTVFVNEALSLLCYKGNDHLVMLTVDGALYTSGCGEQGQLGRVPECFASRGGRKGLGMLFVICMMTL